MPAMDERVARLEERSDNHTDWLDDLSKEVIVLENDVKKIVEKVNGIAIRWTIAVTAGAALGATALQFLVSVIAKKMELP